MSTPIDQMSDSELNRAFAREFWDRPIDERNNTYWHDDDTTPAEENGEWRPLPDFCNDWVAVRKIFARSSLVIPPDGKKSRTKNERCRRTMIHLLRNIKYVTQ